MPLQHFICLIKIEFGENPNLVIIPFLSSPLTKKIKEWRMWWLLLKTKYGPLITQGHFKPYVKALLILHQHFNLCQSVSRIYSSIKYCFAEQSWIFQGPGKSKKCDWFFFLFKNYLYCCESALPFSGPKQKPRLQEKRYRNSPETVAICYVRE